MDLGYPVSHPFWGQDFRFGAPCEGFASKEAKCLRCGQSAPLSLRVFKNPGPIRAGICNECGAWIKVPRRLPGKETKQDLGNLFVAPFYIHSSSQWKSKAVLQCDCGYSGQMILRYDHPLRGALKLCPYCKREHGYMPRKVT